MYNNSQTYITVTDMIRQEILLFLCLFIFHDFYFIYRRSGIPAFGPDKRLILLVHRKVIINSEAKIAIKPYIYN